GKFPAGQLGVSLLIAHAAGRGSSIARLIARPCPSMPPPDLTGSPAYRCRSVSAVATAAERAPRGRALLSPAIGVTVALWASAFVAIRYADRALSPGALALGRLSVGSLALGLLVLVRRERLPGRQL